MNTFRITTISLATAALLASCNEYELEGSAFRAFKTAYDQNFINNVGDIDPNQSWDFSTAGGNRGQAAVTRAVQLEGEWYYPEDKTLNWMKNELKESTDNSDKCQDFFLSWTPGMTFQIVPIYEGKATMDWDLYMKVSSTSGSTLFEKKIWSKGKNVQIYGPTLWQFTDDEVSIWYETTSSSVKIWPWNDQTGTSGEVFTGGAYGYKDMTKVGTHFDKNVFKWTSPYDKNSTQGIPNKVKFMPEGKPVEEIAFRNHGYVYQGTPNYAGHDEGRSDGGYDSQISRYDDSNVIWRDFTGEDDAALAFGFRAKPIEISELSSNSWPLGSIVSFYLHITNNHGLEGCAETNERMSTLNHQIVYLNVPSGSIPDNVDSEDGVITGIMGCEDSSRNGYYFDRQGEGETKIHPREKGGSEENLIYYWGKSDWDYNDVVFLINGVMPKPVVITNDVSVSTVEKRYMAEDLTDTGDMDFNDIVVDVKNVRYTYWNVNESTGERKIDTDLTGTKSVEVNGVTLNLNFKNGICDVQSATVKHLCGTIPIRFKVGDTMLPWITNPTVLEQSQKQLNGTFNGTPTYGTGSESTSGIDPNVTLTVTGWDPKTNNVVVYAGWDAHNGVATTPATDSNDGIYSGSEWWSTFPERGSVPCIIATDVKDMWTPECVDITVTPWWHDNFISTKH